ncbi:MAG: ATP-binding protein [Burkholderiaceae bacterium]
MIPRHARPRLEQLARGFPVVVLTGPRQSGKTTLARATFPRHAYVSLEDPDVRERVADDPRGFLAAQAMGTVIDEVQRVPGLLSYLQSAIDAAPHRMGRFILTGSQNLLLSAAVSQSLAGRAGYLELLPLAYAEAADAFASQSLDERLVRGGYPALLARPVAAADWHASYVASYVERDVRQISRIADLLQFQRFMRLMAARTGQMLNLSAVANDIGIAQTTARDWLAVLEASYIVFRLLPYHTNFGKRLVKTPKLYFHDTGLAAWLLGIVDAATMSAHAMRGALFENMMVSDYLKYCRHHGLNNGLYFWRDNIGTEIDLLIERAGTLWPVEFNSGATFQGEWLRGLHTWSRHAAVARRGQGLLVCNVPGHFEHQGIMVSNWRDALRTLMTTGA